MIIRFCPHSMTLVSEWYKAENDFVWQSKDKVQSFIGCQSNSLKPLCWPVSKGWWKRICGATPAFVSLQFGIHWASFFLLRIHFLSPKKIIFPQSFFLIHVPFYDCWFSGSWNTSLGFYNYSNSLWSKLHVSMVILWGQYRFVSK